MPLNYLEIRKQVKEFGNYTADNQENTKEALAHLRQLLEEYADRQDEVCAQVELTRKKHPSLRCALPAEHALNRVFDQPDFQIPDMFLLASDGSQIFPDSHGIVDYGVVNTGLLVMRYHTEKAPDVLTKTTMYYPGVAPFDKIDLSESMISFLRDVDERCFLTDNILGVQIDFARENDGVLIPILGLTDGPLDLFAKPETGMDQSELEFNRYLDSLRALHDKEEMIAGYINRPRGAMLVRTLELMETGEDRLTSRQPLEREYAGISDIMLFAHLLKPGQRSGIFKLVSKNSPKYAGDKNRKLGLHFFYINVGFWRSNGTPVDAFARVEIPEWIAIDEHKVALIHQILIEQSRILGTLPYPYLLHRAHETAIVRFAEKEELDRLITAAMMTNGVVIGSISQKAANKRISGS